MTKRTVALVIHDGVQALDVAGPLDVFAEANEFVGQNDRYEMVVVGPTAKVLRASNGMRLVPDLSFEEAGQVYQTALVAGGPLLHDDPGDMAMSAWLVEWAARAERYGSICTGAFALGRAGLLDGRLVTTHWEKSARLAAAFPKARVEADRIFLRDGHLVTSAGVTAGIDLALSLVAEDHGSNVALSCAKRLVVAAQRQGGQSQFSPHLVPQSPPGSPLARVQAHVQDFMQELLSVERLAEIAGISARSLARLFTTEMGLTPHEFVERVRIDHARNLLESSSKPLKVIAFDCGFGGAEKMRVVFQRRLGISPAAYRSSFQPERERLSA